MNPKEKALEWLEKHGEKIREKEYDEITNKMLAFEVIGYETESIEKALDIALKEQASQIIREIRAIYQEGKGTEDPSSYKSGWNDALLVVERKIERKYLEGEG